jgi:hypothetical protein
MVKAVFAGQELASFYQAKEIEGVLAAQNAGMLQLRGDGLGSRAGRDVDVGGMVGGWVGRRRDGNVDDVRHQGGGDECKQQQGCEELQA